MPQCPAQTVAAGGHTCDAALPADANLAQPCCSLHRASVWTLPGRPGSAKINNQRLGTPSVPAHKEKWSRGCRRAHKSFWLWLWPLSWQLAPRKRPSLHRKLPSSRPTPASTSKITARAWRLLPARPAALFCLPSDGLRHHFPSSPAGSRRLGRAAMALLARGPARSRARC
jgi:hypothetical protein